MPSETKFVQNSIKNLKNFCYWVKQIAKKSQFLLKSYGSGERIRIRKDPSILTDPDPFGQKSTDPDPRNPGFNTSFWSSRIRKTFIRKIYKANTFILEWIPMYFESISKHGEFYFWALMLLEKQIWSFDPFGHKIILSEIQYQFNTSFKYHDTKPISSFHQTFKHFLMCSNFVLEIMCLNPIRLWGSKFTHSAWGGSIWPLVP